MEIAYQISQQDYLDARDLFLRNERPLYRRISRRLLPWLGIAVLLVQFAYLITVPNPEPVLVVIGFAVGFYLIYCGIGLRRYFRKLYQKDHRFKHAFSANISDEGIRIATPFSDSQLKWNAFIRVLESESIFLLFIAEWNFVILPKRAFSPEQAIEFKGMLSQRIIAPAV